MMVLKVQMVVQGDRQGYKEQIGLSVQGETGTTRNRQELQGTDRITVFKVKLVEKGDIGAQGTDGVHKVMIGAQGTDGTLWWCFI